MTKKSRPTPCFLDKMIPVKGQERWRSADGKRLYTWDSLHGEIEVFNKRGYHLGSLDAVTGKHIKPYEKGRRIVV